MTDPSKITAVLVGGEWVEIKAGSFGVGQMVYKRPGDVSPMLTGGPSFEATTSDGGAIAGPLNAVQAVKSGGSATVTRKAGRPPKAA